MRHARTRSGGLYERRNGESGLCCLLPEWEVGQRCCGAPEEWSGEGHLNLPQGVLSKVLMT